MVTGKGFSDRVEIWLARIPGIRTYRDREHRRETDKKIREHLASRLQEVRFELQRLALDWSQGGLMDGLEELDRANSWAQQLADSIRYANYGYSGIFAPEKIREEELSRLYEFDLSLTDDLDQLQSRVGELNPQTPPAQRKRVIGEVNQLLGALEHQFNQRHDFIIRPA